MRRPDTTPNVELLDGADIKKLISNAPLLGDSTERYSMEKTMRIVGSVL